MHRVVQQLMCERFAQWIQNSRECAPGKSSRMNTKFESVVEMVNPSVLAEFYDVNASRCAAIDVLRVGTVDSGFARTRTGQIEPDEHQI
jgi:hypothetical protein